MKIMRRLRALAALLVLTSTAATAAAEDNPAPKPDAPAKQLFGASKTPAHLQARSIGFYAKGCLAGGKALPIDGKTWHSIAKNMPPALPGEASFASSGTKL